MYGGPPLARNSLNTALMIRLMCWSCGPSEHFPLDPLPAHLLRHVPSTIAEEADRYAGQRGGDMRWVQKGMIPALAIGRRLLTELLRGLGFGLQRMFGHLVAGVRKKIKFSESGDRKDYFQKK